MPNRLISLFLNYISLDKHAALVNLFFLFVLVVEAYIKSPV